MRYVPRESLTPEIMKLARPVLGANGETMMNSGSPIRSGSVSLMRKYGINGAFVHDEISGGLDIPDILSQELRAHAIGCVYDTYTQAGRQRRADDPAKLSNVSAAIADAVIALGSNLPNLIDVKSYDYSSYFHALNVALLSVVTGQGMGLERPALCELAYAGLVHDVGKMFIDARIVSKVDALSYAEMEMMRRHPKDGHRFLRQKYPEITSETILRGVLEHHERQNGSGYPGGLIAPDIADAAKILAVADVYDAMTSERPYRSPASPAQALAYLRQGKGTLFDEEATDAFLRRVAPYPTGTCVELSDGTSALVTRNDAEHMERPDVRVFAKDKKPVPPAALSLSAVSPDAVFILNPQG